MKKLLLTLLAVCGYSVNVSAVDMQEVKAVAGSAKDNVVSFMKSAKVAAMYHACILKSKMSDNKAASEKQCEIDARDARIAELEEENAKLQLKLNQKQ